MASEDDTPTEVLSPTSSAAATLAGISSSQPVKPPELKFEDVIYLIQRGGPDVKKRKKPEPTVKTPDPEDTESEEEEETPKRKKIKIAPTADDTRAYDLMLQDSATFNEVKKTQRAKERRIRHLRDDDNDMTLRGSHDVKESEEEEEDENTLEFRYEPDASWKRSRVIPRTLVVGRGREGGFIQLGPHKRGAGGEKLMATQVVTVSSDHTKRPHLVARWNDAHIIDPSVCGTALADHFNRIVVSDSFSEHKSEWTQSSIHIIMCFLQQYGMLNVCSPTGNEDYRLFIESLMQRDDVLERFKYEGYDRIKKYFTWTRLV